MPCRARSSALLILCAALLAGCASNRAADLRPAPHHPLADQFRLKSWFGPKPSERTLLVLRKKALADGVERRLDKRPDAVLADLAGALDYDPQLETVYALAELHYIAAGRAEHRDEKRAIRHYLACVERTCEYLFDPMYDDVRNPYDPQFRGACDLYNSALERCLRFARKDGLIKPGGKVSFATVGSRLNLQIVPRGFTWSAEDFDQFEFVSDYDLKGIANQYQTHGLGVPLIAIRRGGTSPPAVERYYAPNLSFPITAFLRLKKFDRVKGEPSSNEAILELHDPLETTDVKLAGLRVPLESDVTTPLAYFLDQPQVQKLDGLGLFRVDKAKKIAGLYMVQPYQPGKIPVLMIHGLWSSPMTWMEAFNDLRTDPSVREKYQFWFYLYPSGQPFWESAADLREHLAHAQRLFDPDQKNHSFENMVLVGHSMGGLVARMVSQPSGDQYWNAVSRTPFVRVKGDPETLREFERVYYFEPVPMVSRIVTMGTPHRGSYFANDITRRLARSLIYFPKKTMDATTQLVKMNPGTFRGDAPDVAKTSIDSLSPDSPILQVLAESQRPEGVAWHNVVGIVKHDVPLERNTDGIVPYLSSHRLDVDSELVVRADHTHVHRNPHAVAELRRILMLHRKQLAEQADGGVIQIRAEQTGAAEPPRPNPEFE